MSQSRAWTLGEEVAHSVTHGIGMLAAVAGLVVLLILAAATRDPWRITSCAIYATTLVLLYAASTLYHALSATRARDVLRVLDHSAIFLLIAGTYTPFALVSLRGPWGWTLLGIVWSLAIAGVVAKAVYGTRWPVMSTVLYLAMGWTVVIAVKPLLTHVPPGGIAWLVAGGLAYTFGVVFYAWTRLRYGHAIWHVFVLAGSVCHYIAVVLYVV
ncbi:MAG TPA: hemolysin III family protein [Vicinamibacterales bacterium]|nr:hemolysin III family protein [Vicinamibacterales bacterium]